jgi:Protein of unknown function (DUF3499)
VKHARACTRTGCGRGAVATLTYVYSDSTAVVGPLATSAEPHSYDLCEEHAVRLTVPRGWEVVRHAGDFPVPVVQPDDLEALADAVREAGRVEPSYPSHPGAIPRPGAADGTGSGDWGATSVTRSRRGHLRVVPPTGD